MHLDPAPTRLQRARGRAEVAVSWRRGRVRLDRLFQQGCAKALLPRTHGPVPEAVLINTSGGVTGGDRLDWRSRPAPAPRWSPPPRPPSASTARPAAPPASRPG